MARQFRTKQLQQPRLRLILPDPFYYLSNFETVIASLDARYADLWSDEERQFLAAFKELPKASRALLVRMVMRAGTMFRASRLTYPEIGETAVAVAPLISLGWVDDEPKLDACKLQGLITKTELLQSFAWIWPFRNLHKSDLVAMLQGQCPQSKSFQTWCRQSTDRVYHLRVAPLCERLRLMFFGHFHQDWSAFVLRDLGIVRYEEVPSALESRPFGCRAHVDAFEQLYLCGRMLDTGVAWDQVVAAMPEPIAGSDWLEGQRQKLLLQVGQAVERAGNATAALAVYSTCSHRGALVRRIRLLERAQERETARDLCVRGIGTSENEELEQLGRLLSRLNRKLGVTGKVPRKSTAVPTFEIVRHQPDNDMAVEYCALHHLKQTAQGHSTVHYVENGLVNSLFGLLCWKAIFAPIPGAFFHDFQFGPADLASADFHERRRREFAECLAQLETGVYQSTIRRTFTEKAGIQSPFVAWRLSKTLLESAMACIPAAHLKVWFEWILRDVSVNRAGFPDLVQFWPLERRYRMIEVKGPGDRLQDNQRRLLEHCVSHAMPVEVCHVRWAEG